MLSKRPMLVCTEGNKYVYICQSRGKYAIKNTAEYVLFLFVEDKHLKYEGNFLPQRDHSLHFII